MSTDTLNIEAMLGFLASPLTREIPGTRPDLDEASPEDRRVLMGLCSQSPRIDPPADLFADIEAEIDRADLDGTDASPIRTIRSDEGDWKKVTDKIWKKTLLHDEISGRRICLLRCQPGAVIPAHRHDHDEVVFMIEGEYRSPDGIVRAGDIQISRTGSYHEASVSPQGCLLMVQSA